MADILQTAISNAWFLMQMFEFRLELSRNIFPGIQLKFIIGSGNGLVPNRRQAIICTNGDPALRRV